MGSEMCIRDRIFDLPVSDDIEGELVIDTPKKTLSPKGSDDIDTDYQYARENLYNVIERGSDALNTLVEIANQSESPRAFEIVSTLIKTLSDSNKDLLEIQTKVKKLKEETNTPNNVTNALFIGNTTELQKLIKDRKKDV